MIKGIIFDLDGVLTDTSKHHYRAWKRLAWEKLNYDLTLRDNDAFLGVSRTECIEILEKMARIRLSNAQREEYLATKNGYYLEFLQTLTSDNLYDGTERLIVECKVNYLKLAVASASKNTRIVLEKTGIIDCFDTIVDGNCVKKTKPDPECFLLAAKRIGLKPSECIIVEDAQAGIDGARIGGFKCVGIGKKTLQHADIQFEEIKQMRILDVLSALT